MGGINGIVLLKLWETFLFLFLCFHQGVLKYIEFLACLNSKIYFFLMSCFFEVLYHHTTPRWFQRKMEKKKVQSLESKYLSLGVNRDMFVWQFPIPASWWYQMEVDWKLAGCTVKMARKECYVSGEWIYREAVKLVTKTVVRGKEHWSWAKNLK